MRREAKEADLKFQTPFRRTRNSICRANLALAVIADAFNSGQRYCVHFARSPRVNLCLCSPVNILNVI